VVGIVALIPYPLSLNMNDMKKILFAPLLFLSACDADEPAVVPEPQYPIIAQTLWEAKVEDLTGLIDEETCYPFPGATSIPGDKPIMELRRYTGCKGFNVTADVPLEYWYLKEVDPRVEAKEETWLCVAHSRGELPTVRILYNVVFEDKDNILYPSDADKLNLNMKVKVAQRDTRKYPVGTLPHFTFEQVNKSHQTYVRSITLGCRIECIGIDGQVNAHLKYDTSVDYNYKAGPPYWVDGPDVSQFGEMRLLIVDNGGSVERSILHNSGWNIQLLQYKSAAGNGINNLPMPPSEGYLRWTMNAYKIVAYPPNPGGELWAILVNNVEITTTDASQDPL
jgi:hypothetical protein